MHDSSISPISPISMGAAPRTRRTQLLTPSLARIAMALARAVTVAVRVVPASVAAVTLGLHAAGQTIPLEMDQPDLTVANERFGTAVCGLLDVDGDGVPDYAVASARAPLTSPPTAGAPVVRVLSGLTDETIIAFELWTSYGEGVCLAGLDDLDGDGAPELLVGEPDLGSGRAEIFSLRTGLKMREHVGAAGTAFGSAVANLGDVNGDGVDDYAIGAPDDGGHDHGKVWTYSGKTGALIEARAGAGSALHFGAAIAGIGDIQLDGQLDAAASGMGNGIQLAEVLIYTPTWSGSHRTHSSPLDTPNYGIALAGGSDISGDGFPEYFVGDPMLDLFGTFDAGAVHAYDGPTGFQYWISTYASQPCWQVGWAVELLPDIDGDGYGDLVTGGLGTRVVFSGKTGSFLSFGVVGGDHCALGEEDRRPVASLGTSGLGLHPAYVSARPTYSSFANPLDGVINPSRFVAGSWSHADVGVHHSSGFGGAVLMHPDLDGDGRPDVIAGIEHDSTTAADGGGVRAFSSAGGGQLWTRFGATGSQLGRDLALLGDVDGDGVADLAAGAPRGFVFLFGVSDTRTGKIEILSGATGALIRTLKGAQDGEQLGLAVASAGDVDGDGLADVLAGAPAHAAIGGLVRDAGRVALFSSATGQLLRQWTGTSPSQRLGWDVAGPGDLDGDGVADCVYLSPGTAEIRARAGATGAKLWDASSTAHTLAAIGDINGDGVGDVGAGINFFQNQVKVHSGISGSTLASLDGTAGFGTTVSGAGDVDLDGKLDVASGAPGANPEVHVLRDPLGNPEVHAWGGTYQDFGRAIDGGLDFDLDGIPDLVAGTPASLPQAASVQMLSSRSIGCTPFGNGTPGCAGKHLLVAATPPDIGGTMVVNAPAGVPGSPASLIIGLGQEYAGLDVGLGFLLHVNPFTILVNTTTTASALGAASFPIPIPYDSGLVGVVVHAQAGHFGVPGACGLPLGLSSSQGLTLSIGSY